ncbi:UBN2_3 domain-containing protein [Cephalotus follicularis]|uniref:UBN2_3 domain-containing protein n=1 Tax=Cephalotus follicularis TaxID=3775 RepID=A0A1Q3C8P4_CEPFO|nr:UBN2_3 domain-containing protein [Cephalotus follicularis]
MAETKVPYVTPSPNETINVTITSIKLKGSSNYLLWAQVVKIYIMAKKKLKFLNSDPPVPDTSGYEDWMQKNAVILIWLWNNMEPEIDANAMFHNTAKGV